MPTEKTTAFYFAAHSDLEHTVTTVHFSINGSCPVLFGDPG